ncbi:MAG: hypothetical protein JSS27_15440 [Planctomycetes bacterium]|nr:hypothetical protein [Planctomycetota bacterium]
MPRLQSLTARRVPAICALLLAMTVLAQSGCAPLPRFMRQCSAAAARSNGMDPAGCWSGYWASHKSSHKGCLKGSITHCGGPHYRVKFHATFFKFFSYAYETTLTVTEQDGVYHFTGQHDLGRLAGGVYYYDGTIQGNEFRATYRCCKDHGVFIMQRQSCCGGCCP